MRKLIAFALIALLILAVVELSNGLAPQVSGNLANVLSGFGG